MVERAGHAERDVHAMLPHQRLRGRRLAGQAVVEGAARAELQDEATRRAVFGEGEQAADIRV